MVAVQPKALELTGFVFPEDVSYGAAPESGWLFLVRAREGFGMIVGQRFAPAEQAARIPHQQQLADSRVLHVGMGALGAPAAHLLLQSRVGHLRAVDADDVEVGNAVRWPLGLAAVGSAKVDVIAVLAREHYPETVVDPIRWRIGGSALGDGPDEREALERALADVDLVIDTTAEPGVQQLLANECWERGLPFIVGEAREGGHGGLVFRQRRGGACWMCLKWHQDEGRFLPPFDETTGTVQPRGCASPTFTGAAFDLAPVSALVARLVAQTLCASPSFPDARWDIAVLVNHAAGAPELYDALPRWEYATLSVHPNARRRTEQAELVARSAPVDLPCSGRAVT